MRLPSGALSRNGICFILEVLNTRNTCLRGYSFKKFKILEERLNQGDL